MEVSIDGEGVESRQLYGRPLPTSVVNEPELDDEEFAPDRPVRGWFIFEFTSLSYDAASKYFSCGSQMLDKVKFKLSVWDSKRRRKWDEVKSLADLGPSACIAIPLATTPKAADHPYSSGHPSLHAPKVVPQLTECCPAADGNRS